MAILDFDNEKEVKEYEKFLNNFGIVSFMQDLRWGKIKRNWKEEAVYIKDEGKICGCMMILIQKVPYTNFSFMYSPRGPVCDLNNIKIINDLLDEVEALRKKYNAYCITFDPAFIYDETTIALLKEHGYIIKNRNINPHLLTQPRYEAKIDLLGKSEEEIISSFSQKTRYNLKLAGKHNVIVRRSNSLDDLKKFYELYEITAVRDKIGKRNYDYFTNMLRVYDDNSLKIFVAEHDGSPIAASIAINFGKEVFYAYGASSNEKRNLMPNYIMQMDMIRWAMENKCLSYNFGGVIENNKNDGLYRFKIGFVREKGYFEYIGEITKVYNPLIYNFVNSGLKLKRNVSKGKSIIKQLIKIK